MRLGWSAWAAIGMAIAGAAMVGCSGAEHVNASVAAGAKDN